MPPEHIGGVVQASAEPASAVAAPAPVSGAGVPLPTGARADMEGSFGTSFASVRVHEGGEAAALGARAFTHGDHVHFAPGRFAPDTTTGRSLLGHELTHVVQQRSASLGATFQAKGVDINADPALEAEADDLGARAARGESVRVGSVGSSSAPGAPVVQRAVLAAAENVEDRDRADTDATIGTAKKKDLLGADPSKNLMVGFGEGIGNKKWRTQVKWADPTPKGVKSTDYGLDGTAMEANPIGPDHPMGCGPTDNTKVNSGRATQSLGVSYIAGHLLNDNLGGSGDDPRNITAIPEDVNKNMSKKVEEPLKAEVNGRGLWAYYKVEVTHGNGTDKLATKLVTRWHLFNEDGSQGSNEQVDAFDLTNGNHGAQVNAALGGGTLAQSPVHLGGKQSPLVTAGSYGGLQPLAYPDVYGQKRADAAVDTAVKLWDRFTREWDENAQLAGGVITDVNKGLYMPASDPPLPTKPTRRKDGIEMDRTQRPDWVRKHATKSFDDSADAANQRWQAGGATNRISAKEWSKAMADAIQEAMEKKRVVGSKGGKPY